MKKQLQKAFYFVECNNIKKQMAQGIRAIY